MRALLPRLPLAYLGVVLGCSAPAGAPERSDVLHIEDPTDGAVLSNSFVTVRGSTEITDAIEVQINGQTFPVAAGRFEGTLELAEGPARISARIGSEETFVDVIVDTTAPVIVVDSPEIGAFIEGDIMTVRGHVTDATLETFTIDEAPVLVHEDGSFVHERTVEPGSHRMRLHATDRVGHDGFAYAAAVVGHFQDSATPLPEALVLEVGQDALDTIGDGIEPYLAPSQLQPLLLAANPVTEGFWGELDVVSETHGPVEMVFSPGSGSMVVAIALPNVRMPLRADISVGGSISGELTCTRAIGRATLTVGVEAGRPVVSVASVDVTLEGLLIDVHGLWSWIDRSVVTAAARGMLETKVEELIAEQVPLRLESALAALDQIASVPVGGGTATLSNELHELTVSYDGLRAVVDMSIDPLDVDAELDARSLGVLVTAGEAPSGDTSGMFAALSTDVLTSAMHAFWVRGAMRHRFEEVWFGGGPEPLNMARLSAFVPALGGLAPPEARIVFEIDAILPPIAEAPTEGLLAAEIADMRLRAYADSGNGEPIALFEVSAGLRAELRAVITDDMVAVDVIGFAATAEIISAPDGVPVGGELDDLITGIVGPKLEELLRYDVAIPTLAGFRVSAPAAGHQNGYLEFEATLDLIN